MLTIQKHKRPLSDGSAVFHVALADDGGSLIFDAIDEDHADALIDELNAALNRHTIHPTEIKYGTAA